MVEGDRRPRPRRDADRADLGLPPLLPRRRRPGPRRRRAPALRRAQLAADRHRVGGALLLLRDDHRARRRLLRRLVDQILSRILDVIWAFPVFLPRSRSRSSRSRSGITSARSRSRAGSLWLPIRIIGVIYVPYVARPIRGQVLSVREKEFVEAAIGLGASNWRLIFSRGPAERDHDGDRLLPAHDRDEHADRVGALVPLDRRPAARRELGHDHQRRPGPALHAAVGRDRAGHRDRDRRCSPSTCSATACATRSTRAPSCGHRPPVVALRRPPADLDGLRDVRDQRAHVRDLLRHPGRRPRGAHRRAQRRPGRRSRRSSTTSGSTGRCPSSTGS